MKTTEQKSWKKINQERKDLKKKRKQEKVLKQLQQAKKLADLTEIIEEEDKAEEVKSISTVSIAIPGSILENAQSIELRTYLAGQIARAACIFKVDEVIIYDDHTELTRPKAKSNQDSDGQTTRNSCLQLARILQYLECPQYLRKFFFPIHSDLQYSALLNPLDAPHHLRQQSVFLYREGIVTEKKAKNNGCYVNVGLLNDVFVDKPLSAGVRVTVKMENPGGTKTKNIKGSVVSPSEPASKTGVYWGYSVRIAHSFSDVFTKPSYEEGYDAIIGTSDRGSPITEVPNRSMEYNHALIVFGGLKGLEAALENDDKLNLDDPKLLFEHYINVLPNQGSRTIRTEEAVLITLAALSEKLKPNVERMECKFSEYLPQSIDTGVKLE